MAWNNNWDSSWNESWADFWQHDSGYAHDYPSWNSYQSYSGSKGRDGKGKAGKGKGKGAKGKAGKGVKSDGKSHGNSHSPGGPYLCIKCGDASHFTKDCQCPYNRAYYSYMKETIEKSRIALERESTELCVQERLFSKNSIAKKNSRYEGSFDPKESVLTTGWDPATAPADLITFAQSRSRGFRGTISFTRKDSVFIFVTVIFVFKTKSYAHAFTNHVNEHASGNSWSYGEPVLAWIPKKGTIESIVGGVDASRDISIQEWAKSQNSSSEESGNESNDNDKQARRKKAKIKQAEEDASSSSSSHEGSLVGRCLSLLIKSFSELSSNLEVWNMQECKQRFTTACDSAASDPMEWCGAEQDMVNMYTEIPTPPCARRCSLCADQGPGSPTLPPPDFVVRCVEKC